MRPRMKTYPVGRVIESTYARRNGKERYHEGGGSPLGDLLSGIPWLKTHSLVTRFRNSLEPKIRAVPHDIVRIYRDTIRLRTIWWHSVSLSPSLSFPSCFFYTWFSDFARSHSYSCKSVSFVDFLASYFIRDKYDERRKFTGSSVRFAGGK